jgi:hypothetical protein
MSFNIFGFFSMYESESKLHSDRRTYSDEAL